MPLILQPSCNLRKGVGGAKTGSTIFRSRGVGDLGPICKDLSDRVGRIPTWPVGQRIRTS